MNREEFQKKEDNFKGIFTNLRPFVSRAVFLSRFFCRKKVLAISTASFLFGLVFILLAFFPVKSAPPPVQGGVGMSVTIEGATPTPTPPGGGGGGGGGEVPTLPTKVVFEGKAYPEALLTLSKNGTIASTFKAYSSGLFRQELTGMTGGIYTFSVFAEDTDGRKSVTLSFSISVLAGRTTTISGIYLSPTISLNPTQVERGEKIDIGGQIYPESQIQIFVASKEFVKDTVSDSKGKWNYKLDTASLEEIEHNAKAMGLTAEGEQSPFSQSVSFLVVKPGTMVCHGADFNFDGKVNIIDFSIMMYWWGPKKPGNPCVDLNSDGKVDIIDFSILLYWWTG